MQKRLFFWSLLFISGNLFAQESFQLSFSLAPSVNWMSAEKNEISGGDIKAGYDFGMVADIFFDDRQRYALSTGLLLANTGGELEYHNTSSFNFAGKTVNPGSSIRYRLKYLEIPFAVKLRTSQFRGWTYWGQFGLSGFINVGAKGDTNDGVLDKSDIKDEIRSLNIAMNLGVGVNFSLSPDNSLVIGVIFKDGLIDVTKDHYHEGKTTVNSVILKLGLIF
ncbi:MAG: porin family protein [Mangrovibacterium sp.]